MAKRNNTVKIEITEDEMAHALVWAAKAEDYMLKEMLRPSRSTRRDLRRGNITTHEIREAYRVACDYHEKLAEAFLGINAEELRAAIKELDKQEKKHGK